MIAVLHLPSCLMGEKWMSWNSRKMGFNCMKEACQLLWYRGAVITRWTGLGNSPALLLWRTKLQLTSSSLGTVACQKHISKRRTRTGRHRQTLRRLHNRPWHRRQCSAATHQRKFLFFFYKFILFLFGCIGFSLPRAGFSLVAASGGYSSLWCAGFSLRWLLLLWSTGSRCVGFSSCGSWAQ